MRNENDNNVFATCNEKPTFHHPGLDPGSPFVTGDSCFRRNEETGYYQVKVVLILLLALLGLLSSCQSVNRAKSRGIVVLSPEVAEIICALGAQASISGVTEECNYPPALKSVKKIGNFSSIDREAIIALNPRLVFCSSLEQEGMATELGKLGIKVEVVYPKSLQELLNEINRIGSLIGKQGQAKELTSQMQNSINKIRSNTASQARPRVYLEIYRNPLMSVSDRSFVGELIETAGGDNVFSTLERDYARVNPEAVIKAAPDIMICYSQDKLTGIIDRKGWQDIPAIRNKAIYFEADINPDLLQRATPRCIEGMQKLQEIFYQDGRGK